MDSSIVNIKLMADIADLQAKMQSATAMVGSSMRGIESHIGRATQSMGAFAAVASAAALGGAFISMTKNIVDGLDAFNDLKDATGASIENISALEDVAIRSGASFDTVSTSLTKFNKLLSDAKPGSDAERAIEAIGLKVKDLKALDPADAVTQMAKSLSSFADDANKARLVQELFGKSLKEMAPFLNDLAQAGTLNATVTEQQAEEAEKLNKQFSAMEADILLVKRAIAESLIPTMRNFATETLALQKTQASWWDGFTTQAQQNPFKSLSAHLAEYRDELSDLQRKREEYDKSDSWLNDSKGLDVRIEKVKRTLNYYKEIQLQKMEFDKSDQTGAEDARLGLVRRSVGDVVGHVKEPKTGSASAAQSAYGGLSESISRQLEMANAEIDAIGQKLSTADKQRLESIGKITDAFVNGKVTEKQWIELTDQAQQAATARATADGLNYVESLKQETEKIGLDPTQLKMYEAEQRAAIQPTKELTSAVLDQAEAWKARTEYFQAADDLQRTVGDQQKRTAAIEDEVAKERDRIAAMGLSKEAIAELEATRIEEMATARERLLVTADEIDLSGTLSDSIKKEVAELRERAKLKREGAAKEVALENDKENFASWKRGLEETDRLAREVFVSWNGDAEKIGETLKRSAMSALYDLYAKPFVLQVYTSIVGGPPGGMGNLLGGGIGGLGGLLGGGGLFGSGFNAGLGAVFGESGTLGGLSAGLTGIGAGNLAGGFGTLLGAAAPWLAGASLLGSVFGEKKFETKYGGQYETGEDGKAKFLSGPGTGGQFSGAASQIDNTVAGLNSLFEKLGIKDRVNYFSAGAESSGEGEGFSYAGGRLSNGKQFGNVAGEGYLNNRGNKTPEEAAKEFTQEMKRASLEAFAAATDVPKAIQAKIDGVDIEHLSAPAVDALYESVNKVIVDATSLQAAMDGLPFFAVGQAGFDAAAGLNAAAGALAGAGYTAQQLIGQLQSYYSDFYTPEEQRSFQIDEVLKTLNENGGNYTREQIANLTREQVRAEVDRINKDTSFTQAQRDKLFAAALAKERQIAAIAKGTRTVTPTGTMTYEEATKLEQERLASGYYYPNGDKPSPTGGGSDDAAASEALKAWQDATNAIVETMNDLRTTLMGTDSDSLERMQAQFAIQVAQASAGDLNAYKDLPALAKAMVNANASRNGSSVDQALFNARIIETLGSVAGIVNLGSNLSVPHFDVGTNVVPHDMLAVVHRGEAIVPPQYNPALGGGYRNSDDFVEAVRRLDARLANIEAHALRTADSTSKSSKVLDEAASGGRPIRMKAVPSV